MQDNQQESSTSSNSNEQPNMDVNVDRFLFYLQAIIVRERKFRKNSGKSDIGLILLSQICSYPDRKNFDGFRKKMSTRLNEGIYNNVEKPNNLFYSYRPVVVSKIRVPQRPTRTPKKDLTSVCCDNCKTTYTSTVRQLNGKPHCNACYIHFRTNKVHRPKSRKATGPVKRRRRKK